MGRIALIFLFLVGCTTGPVVQEPPQVLVPLPEITIPVEEGRPKLAWNKPEWDAFLFGAIVKHGGKLLQTNPGDIADWCPGYKSLPEVKKQHFWAAMIVEAAKWESNWKTGAATYECRKTSCVYSGGCQYNQTHGYCMKGGHKLDGGLVVSRGLMQMSLESSIYLGCPVKTPQDLHDPQKNIECTVIGLNRYIGNSGWIQKRVDGSWKGAAAYWAVFRGTTDYTKKSLAAIKAAAKRACQ